MSTRTTSRARVALMGVSWHPPPDAALMPLPDLRNVSATELLQAPGEPVLAQSATAR